MASDMRSYACAYIYSEHSSDILKKSSLQAHTIFTPGHFNNLISAANRLIGEVVQCTITEKVEGPYQGLLLVENAYYSFHI